MTEGTENVVLFLYVTGVDVITLSNSYGSVPGDRDSAGDVGTVPVSLCGVDGSFTCSVLSLRLLVNTSTKALLDVRAETNCFEMSLLSQRNKSRRSLTGWTVWSWNSTCLK